MKAEERVRELALKLWSSCVHHDEEGNCWQDVPKAVAAILEALRDQREEDAKVCRQVGDVCRHNSTKSANREQWLERASGRTPSLKRSLKTKLSIRLVNAGTTEMCEYDS